MDTATVETPTTAQVEAPAAVETPSSDAPSIADHAKAFSPEAQAAAVEKDDEGSDINRPRDESGKFSRQRAESHRAKPDDVPRIKELTKAFPYYAQPRAVALTLEPWTVENGLITPTLKLKRANLVARYGHVIERLYRR